MTEQTTSRVAVFVEPTPNPNSLKFVVGRQLVQRGPYEFASVEEAGKSAFAQGIFQIEGVEGVFIGSDFVSVRKEHAANWDAIEPKVIAAIEEDIAAGKPLVEEGAAESRAGREASGPEGVIRNILDDEIRPAVAMDGGDVQFQSYDNGVLTLKLVGACSGCPSSLMTLKMGIERRLREDVPELQEVIAAS